LSGNALRLYIFLAHKLYRIRKTEVMYLDWELASHIGIAKDLIRKRGTLAVLTNS
jgi:hypothetical protein